MPLIFSIPNKYKNGFKELATLPDDQFVILQDSLESVSSGADIDGLAEKVANQKGLKEEAINEIFTSVSGLVPFLEDHENLEEIVEDTSLICSNEKLVKESDLQEFSKRLKLLLEDKKIFYASKAEDLLYETGNLFITGKIITDIRPIFDLDPETPPGAGVVMHTLHIHYQADAAAPHKDIYLTLNSNDIQTLIDILIRAEKKEEAMKHIFTKSGMINLNE